MSLGTLTAPNLMDLDSVCFKWSPGVVNNTSKCLRSSYYIRHCFRHCLLTLIYRHFFFLKANVENHSSLAKWQENIITEVEVK